MEKRLIVGVSGASGAPLALETLRALKAAGVESHLVVTRGGEMTLRQECGMTAAELADLCAKIYALEDIAAAPASGSFKTMGMIVVPASMKTVAGIASGYSDNLLLRAADVTLKERRRLVLVVRETPLSPIHLENMLKLSQMGVTILPASPGFYNHPRELSDIVRFMAGKILDQLGLSHDVYQRWKGEM